MPTFKYVHPKYGEQSLTLYKTKLTTPSFVVRFGDGNDDIYYASATFGSSQYCSYLRFQYNGNTYSVNKSRSEKTLTLEYSASGYNISNKAFSTVLNSAVGYSNADNMYVNAVYIIGAGGGAGGGGGAAQNKNYHGTGGSGASGGQGSYSIKTGVKHTLTKDSKITLTVGVGGSGGAGGTYNNNQSTTSSLKGGNGGNGGAGGYSFFGIADSVHYYALGGSGGGGGGGGSTASGGETGNGAAGTKGANKCSAPSSTGFGTNNNSTSGYNVCNNGFNGTAGSSSAGGGSRTVDGSATNNFSTTVNGTSRGNLGKSGTGGKGGKNSAGGAGGSGTNGAVKVVIKYTV